jgi:hypothetical protein
MDRIKVMTSRDAIKQVRNRWLSQYKDYTADQEIGGRDNREKIGVIRKRVKALDLETCTVADVDKAIGTTGWADNECDICHGNHEVVACLGDDPDYEARWLNVCPSCLSKALELTRSPQGTETPND